MSPKCPANKIYFKKIYSLIYKREFTLGTRPESELLEFSRYILSGMVQTIFVKYQLVLINIDTGTKVRSKSKIQSDPK